MLHQSRGSPHQVLLAVRKGAKEHPRSTLNPAKVHIHLNVLCGYVRADGLSG